MRRARLALIAAALLTLPPRGARAADRPQVAVRLRYVVGPGIKRCPPEQALHDEVARRMGYDPFTPDAPDRIVASLKRSSRGLTAMVERFDSKEAPQWEPKTWDLDDCMLLVQAMGIYISFMFRPPVEFPRTEPPPSPMASPPPSPTPSSSARAGFAEGRADTPRAEPLHSPSPPPRPPPFSMRFAANGGVGFGVAPADLAAVMSLEGGVQWPLTPVWSLSGSLGVLFSPPASKRRPVEMSQADVEVRTTLVTSVLAPCLHRYIYPFGWALGCVGFQLGRLWADGAQIPYPASAVAWWAAVDPRLGIEVPLPQRPQLAIRLFGDLPVSLLHPRALVGKGPSMSGGKLAQAWAAPAVTGAVSLGLVGWFVP